MSTGLKRYRDECRCGHARETHHPGGECLGMLCACRGYENAHAPDPAPARVLPKVNYE